jgi:hypothetical protein
MPPFTVCIIEGRSRYSCDHSVKPRAISTSCSTTVDPSSRPPWAVTISAARFSDLSFAAHRGHCNLELGITPCPEFHLRQRNLDMWGHSHAFHDGTVPRVPRGGR